MKLPALLLSLTLPALADQRGDTPGTLPSTPQEQLAKFHVPPGFEVQLVAAEPEIQKPVNLNFDAAGRLWVSGSEMYPWPARTDVNGQPIPHFDKGWKSIVDGFRVGDAPKPSAEPKDTVRILSDFGPDGHARKITVFADKLNIPSGIQPLPRQPGGWGRPQMTPMGTDVGKSASTPTQISSTHPRPSASSAAPSDADPKGDTAIVYSIPNIWLMTDVGGDGFAERREPLYTGFGYTDTHGGASSFIYWIDGWIYGTHGFRNHSEVRDRNGKVTVVDSGNTYRFRPDGTAFEIYAHGQTNPFGLAFDPLGNLFSADSHSKPVYMLLRGGYYEGIGKQHDGLGFAPRITDDDHGSSAIAGIAYYADDKWPEEYRGNLFNGNPVTQRLNRDRLEWHGSTPKAIRMPDFLTCDDPWFRPVNLKLGPDGALYIADFYNPIIGHYEVPLTHPARDHTHGRIWRVVYRGEKAPVSSVAAAAFPGSTGVPPVAAGVPPGASGVEGASSPGKPTSQRRSEVPGGTPATTGGTPVLPVAQPPDLTTLDAPALVEKLADPSLEVRRLATNELVDRVESVATANLGSLVDEANLKPRFTVGRSYSEAEMNTLLALDFLPSNSNARTIHALWALDRLGSLSREVIERSIYGGSKAVHAQLMRILIEHTDFDKQMWRWAGSVGPLVSAVEVWGKHTEFNSWMTPLMCLRVSAIYRTSEEDRALDYAARLALRNHLINLKSSDIPKVLANTPPDFLEPLAEVFLAVKTPESAAFLLAHLERTKLETPRAGEYLKHAVLYLPAEQPNAVVKLVGLVANAPLPQRLALAVNVMQAERQRGIELEEAVTAWKWGAISEALASNNDPLTKLALSAVRDFGTEDELAPLAKIARDEFRDDSLRLAALEAAANLPASHDLLAAAFANPRHMILRKRAAELLAQNGDTATVLAALPQAPWELAVAISGALAKTDPGATALLDAIEAGKASARVLVNKAVVGPFFARPKELQDRAKVLAKDVPPEDARLNLLITQRAVDFLDAPRRVNALEKGAQIFLQQCAVCHRFRNAGGNVGPNLDGVVARGPQRLIEDILDPSRNVDPGFRQTIVETTDGQTLVGTNLREQGDAVLLIDATGKELTTPKAAIKTRTTLNLSLMPPTFETTIPPGEFNDLLAYLLSEAK